MLDHVTSWILGKRDIETCSPPSWANFLFAQDTGKCFKSLAGSPRSIGDVIEAGP